MCLPVSLVAAIFPFAVSEKTLTLLAYFGFCAVALSFAITRRKILVTPLAFSFLMLVASFVIPVEIALVRNKPFGVSWVRCTVIGSMDRIPAAGPEYVIERGCTGMYFVEPVRVVKVCIP
jgi:hypothetical protein